MRAWTTFAALTALTIAVGMQAAGHPVHAQARAAAAPLRLYVFDGGTLESDPARYQLTRKT
jgi:hypothetical protein